MRFLECPCCLDCDIYFRFCYVEWTDDITLTDDERLFPSLYFAVLFVLFFSSSRHQKCDGQDADIRDAVSAVCLLQAWIFPDIGCIGKL